MSEICSVCNQNYPHEHRLDGDRWIGVDLDGTLAEEIPGRTNPYVIGAPVPAMVERVKGWLKAGYPVKIFTARMARYPLDSPYYRDLGLMEMTIRRWCREHIGTELPCTNQKDGGMEAQWCDRAVQVARNQGRPV
jgi:hypothetical protein